LDIRIIKKYKLLIYNLEESIVNMFDIVDKIAVDTIRTLSIDAIQKANSGHPGFPWEPLRWHMFCGAAI